MTWILLIIGFILLTVGATWLTNGSATIAKRLRISEYVIGMTIVAVGTSLPELTVSAASTLAGNTDIAIGNVVGSNIFNVFLILGVCSLIAPILFTRDNIRRDVPICVATSLLLAVMVWNGSLSRIEGVVMLLLYVAVLWYSFRGDNNAEATSTSEAGTEPDETSDFSWLRSGGMVVLGLCGLIYGANLTLDSAVQIARSMGVSEAIIAITLLAGGTSLPELAASVASMLKGHTALALGNVLGSNIANILLILGSCSVIAPLHMSGVTMVDVAMAVAAAVAVMLSALMVGHRRIMWCEGILYLLCYGAYVWYLVK
ncbi:MAG: calcium/sodium antiporter [Alistipes sp.]|nr:calcium/sodium antiporter [Alistipes sp.]